MHIRERGTYLAVPEVRSQDDTPLVLPQQHLTQASLQDATEFGLTQVQDRHPCKVRGDRPGIRGMA